MFLIKKTFSNIGRKENFLNLIQDISVKPRTNIVPDSGRPSTFPVSRNKTGTSPDVHSCIQHCLAGLASAIQQCREIKAFKLEREFVVVPSLSPTPCDPMDCSTPDSPVLHYLLELARTHVHWVGHAVQPSCPLSSPFPPAFHLSQHQGLF